MDMETIDPEAETQTVGKGVRSGAETIAAYLPTLSLGPGVYRMLSAKGDILYVGKARSLRKRVQNSIDAVSATIRWMRIGCRAGCA